MRFYKITAPSADYSGTVGGVGFHKGVARVAEDEAGTALDYFRRKGYSVEVVEETPAKAEAKAGGEGSEQTPEIEGQGEGNDPKPKPEEPKAPAKPAAKAAR
ncbi:hypothetical protein AB0I81_40190 [Nonomuraea sp. NPDC050404]|uniref:hypothetical protein n=1 Tax=Nonomuraea sp. NPDC050404 TaxID=3155783 RepID=UPI0033ED0AA2